MGNVLLCNEDVAGKRGGGSRCVKGYKSAALALIYDVSSTIEDFPPHRLEVSYGIYS